MSTPYGTVALTGTASQAVLGSGPGYFGGISLHVLNAAAAKVRVWDNPSAASGTIVGSYELTASGVGSSIDLVFERAKRVLSGLYVELVSGQVEGSVLVA